MGKGVWRGIRSSISTKLVAVFVLCLILPVLVVGLFFSYRLREVLMDSERSNVLKNAQASVGEMDDLLREMNDVINALAINRQAGELLKSGQRIPAYGWFINYQAFENILQTVAAKSGRSLGVTAISVTGNVYQSGAQHNAFLHLDAPVVQRVMACSGTAIVINRELEGLDASGVLTVGKAYLERGRVLGAVLVDVRLTAVERMLRASTRQGEQMYLLGADGAVIYAEGAGHDAASPMALRQALDNGLASLRIEGTRYMVVSARAAGGTLSMVSLVPEEEVFRAPNRLFAQIVVSMGLILLLTTGMVVLVARRTSLGIRRLNRAVARFGTAGQEEIVLVPRGMDEVGQLTQGAVAMSQRIVRLLERIRQDERTKWQLEFQTLQSQINPHMVYNTLNTITYLAQLQNVANIEEVSSSFARLLRMVAQGGEFTTLAEELACVQAFVAIKQYNLPWDIHYVVEAEEEALTYPVLKLLLQPFVENAIVHGFAGRATSGTVTVRIGLAAERIALEVEDDGVGMDAETLARHLSTPVNRPDRFSNIGVYNTVRRLKLTYGQSATFAMESAPGEGTRVFISYPVPRGEGSV